MRVVILQGISGSGKSTYAKQLSRREPNAVCSADDYFMKRDGSYDWKPELLGKAHASCFAKYLMHFTRVAFDTIVVDNTNLNPVDVSPYVMAANAYTVPWKIVQVGCDPNLAAERCVHGLPRSKVMKQYDRLQNFFAPKDWWPNVTAVGDINFVSNLARRNYEQQPQFEEVTSYSSVDEGDGAASRADGSGVFRRL